MQLIARSKPQTHYFAGEQKENNKFDVYYQLIVCLFFHGHGVVCKNPWNKVCMIAKVYK